MILITKCNLINPTVHGIDMSIKIPLTEKKSFAKLCKQS